MNAIIDMKYLARFYKFIRFDNGIKKVNNLNENINLIEIC